MKKRTYEDLEKIVNWLNERNKIDQFNIKDNEFVICPNCWTIHRETSEWGKYCDYQCWSNAE